MMLFVVTGSSGRLGSALCEKLGTTAIGIDPRPGQFTKFSCDQIEEAFKQIGGKSFVVFHAGALHKPDLKKFDDEQFVLHNVAFTAKLMKLSLALGSQMIKFIYTSTTSVFGSHMVERGSSCVWITNQSIPSPKNTYGLTKRWAEQLVCKNKGDDRFVILRACRFFPEADDRETAHDGLTEENLKFLHVLNGRRLLLEDVVESHLAAIHFKSGSENVEILNLGNQVALSSDMDLKEHAGESLLRAYPVLKAVLEKRTEWSLPTSLDRVYDARETFAKLNWKPKWNPVKVANMILNEEKIPW